MNQKNDQKPVDQPAPAELPAKSPIPRKRFRIEKIEERIAPGGHYNPQSKWVGDGNGDGGGTAQSSVSGSIGPPGATSY